jgi:hypothetical protein
MAQSNSDFIVSVQLNFSEASKVWCFKNLGSQGRLPGTPGWIYVFLEIPYL